MAAEMAFFKWRPHPWHGLEVGPTPPSIVHAYIEMCSFDTVKYEVDKETGYIKVNRPQRSSSFPPTLYGFIPKTLSGKRVQELMKGAKKGDGDPLDICVLSERPINRMDIIANTRVVGGFPMLDNGEADDKIVGILENDPLWANVRDISELPQALIERLRHYFMTYKLTPGQKADVSIAEEYGREHAEKVVRASIMDYDEEYLGLIHS